MAYSPANPPTQNNQPLGAIPAQLVQSGDFVGPANPLVVTSSGSTQAVITTLYECINTFTDTNGTVDAGDLLQNIVIYNSTGVITNNIWNDLTEGFQLANPPAPANVRAYVAGGAATAANQLVEIQELEDISAQLPPVIGPQPVADSLSVVVANQDENAVSVTTLYVANTSSADYNSGNVMQSVSTYTAGNPNVPISTTWNNLTQGLFDVTVTQADMNPLGQSSSGSGAAVITNNYYAIDNVPPDYSVGDVLQNELVIDQTAVPPLVLSSEWTNLTTGQPIAVPTDLTTIRPVGTPTGAGVVSSAGTVTNEYLVLIGSIQADPGDIVEEVISYNLELIPPKPMGSDWKNVTTGAVILPANIPAYGELAPIGSADANTTRVASSALYIAKVNSTPAGTYAVGDIIQVITVFNTNEDPPTTVSTHYDNLTTGLENITVVLSEVAPLGGPIPNPSTIFAEQLTTAIAPVQMPSQTLSNGVVITALPSNTATVYIGGNNAITTSNTYPLLPGQSMSYGVSNLNAIWFFGLNTTDKVAVTGN